MNIHMDTYRTLQKLQKYFNYKTTEKKKLYTALQYKFKKLIRLKINK